MSNRTKTNALTGYARLRDPRLNKGTAFTEAERRAYGLEGLLPPNITNIDLQIARRHAEIASLDSDLQKYLVLSDLQARNETLFNKQASAHAHDWDRRGHLLHRLHPQREPRSNDVWPEPNQVGGEVGEPVQLPLGVAVF